MFTTTNLSAMPYAQATVRKFDNGNIALISYVTTVAWLDNNGWLTIHGLYSATTRRHIGAFVKEYACIDYQTAKRLYNDGMMYNIYTGEVKEI